MNQQHVGTNEARELQIHVAGNSLSQAVSALQMVSLELVRRAEPVLRPQPAGDPAAPNAKTIRCTLAQGMEEEADRIRAVTALLHDTLDRLEL